MNEIIINGLTFATALIVVGALIAVAIGLSINLYREAADMFQCGHPIAGLILGALFLFVLVVSIAGAFVLLYLGQERSELLGIATSLGVLSGLVIGLVKIDD